MHELVRCSQGHSTKAYIQNGLVTTDHGDGNVSAGRPSWLVPRWVVSKQLSCVPWYGSDITAIPTVLISAICVSTIICYTMYAKVLSS